MFEKFARVVVFPPSCMVIDFACLSNLNVLPCLSSFWRLINRRMLNPLPPDNDAGVLFLRMSLIELFILSPKSSSNTSSNFDPLMVPPEPTREE